MLQLNENNNDATISSGIRKQRSAVQLRPPTLVSFIYNIIIIILFHMQLIYFCVPEMNNREKDESRALWL